MKICRFRLKPVFLIVIAAFLAMACDDEVVQKPHNLVKRDKMISVLTDMHLAEAVYQTKRFSSEELNKYSESDFYYTILRKHSLADSVFEKSLIYYSSKPKEFEKIYTRVINRLTEMESEQKEKAQQPLNITNTQE